jgi:glutaminyl-peptide cyclotransferase
MNHWMAFRSSVHRYISRLVLIVYPINKVFYNLFRYYKFTGRFSILMRVLFRNMIKKPVYAFHVIRVYPHDPSSFTQGIVFERGFMYESRGQLGLSKVTKTELHGNEVIAEEYLADQYYGEGLTLWEEKVVQLTWKSGVGFVRDKEGLELLTVFSYPGEGWGITHDHESLIMSDGTSELRFLDPHTFKETRRLKVHDFGIPIVFLNDLQYVKGAIFANVWRTDCIGRISPETGEILGWIDLHRLCQEVRASQPIGELNGIAYDPEQDHLFITGKFWPNLFEIKLDFPLP